MTGKHMILKTFSWLAIAAGCAAATPAHAMGLCEDTPSSWRIVDVAERTGQVVIEGEVGWCEEDDDGDEVRGTLKAARLLGPSGATLQWFADTVNDQTSARLGADGEVQPLSRLEALRKAGGFVKVASLRKSPTGRCAWREALGTPKGEGAHESVGVGIDLLVDGRPAAKESLAEEIAANEPRQIEVVFLAGQRKALIAWALPVCDGGPPAGTFGDGYPGECYVGWRIGARLVRVTDTALEGCFAPAAPTE